MEALRPDWFQIPRESPLLEVEYEDDIYSFDYHNTTIFYFGHNNEQYNHIFHQHHEVWTYMFNCPGMMDTLHEMGYPAHFAEWPSDDDVEAFIQTEMLDVN